MMSRRRRQQEVRDLVERATSVPPEQLGWIMTATFGNAFVALGLQITLLVLLGRSARSAWSVRHDGSRAMAKTALTPPVIPLACAYGVYRAGAQMLLVRWLRRAVLQGEAQLQPGEESRPADR